MLNQSAFQLYQKSLDSLDRLGCLSETIVGAQVIDAGIKTHGSSEAGIVLARLCLGDAAHVSIGPADAARVAAQNSVFIRTDHPLRACLGAQYAGWPVQTDDFFAMGSGPMRMRRGREEMLGQLELTEIAPQVVGVLESDRLPSQSAIELIAEQCGVETRQVNLAVAPTTSIAGCVQIVARSVETSMHKLYELKFDVETIVSATGCAPLPPPSRPGDTVDGIGRTNDAMLYGATVTLFVDNDDEVIESVVEKVPSNSSDDYGQPFATIFKQYDYDFYKVDPMLFSPAVITIHSLRSGRTWTSGSINTSVLRQSFLK